MIPIQRSCCNSAYRLRYWNFTNKLSTWILFKSCNSAYRLRYWNFHPVSLYRDTLIVATVLTVYGIETTPYTVSSDKIDTVATVLTVYGIETDKHNFFSFHRYEVATVLTVYGIETRQWTVYILRIYQQLQQCLPFTVLKRSHSGQLNRQHSVSLQQCLPFTVLKLHEFRI